MRVSRLYGSVRGAVSDDCPYRDPLCSWRWAWNVDQPDVIGMKQQAQQTNPAGPAQCSENLIKATFLQTFWWQLRCRVTSCGTPPARDIASLSHGRVTGRTGRFIPGGGVYRCFYRSLNL